jgi:PAS domain S-box-containing protein
MTDLETPRADAAPLASRADLEAILGQVADGITVQTPSGELVYANDTAARLVGFARAEELLATPVAEVLARFEMLDEDGRELPIERLPGRLALGGVESEAVICYRSRETHTRRWSIVRATPVFDDAGRVRLAVNSFQDITERKRAEERLLLLADAGTLLESLEYESTLARIPSLVVPRLGDACAVWYAADGELRRIATYAEDESKLRDWEGVPDRYSLESDDETLLVKMFREGKPALLPDIAPEQLRTAARDAAEAEALDRLASRSALIVPLVARGQSFGLLNVISFVPNRFTEEDLATAKELTDRVALALDRALLYRDSQQTESDLAFLAQAGELFASSLDTEEILRRIARVVVPRVADACNIFLAEGDVIRRVAHAHVDPELEAVMGDMPNEYTIGPDAPSAFRSILTDGIALLASPLGDEVLGALEAIGLSREAFMRVGSRSMMFVPFVSRGVTLGVITMGARDPRRYTQRDVDLATDLARRAAVAIENARNYERSQERARASQALEFVGDGVLLVDGDGVVRLWNPAAEAITGIPAGDLVGRAASEAIPGWDALVPHVPISLRPETIPLGLPERELWLSISGVDFGDGTVYAFRDVTDEHAVEQMKTDFISTVSHELRTPLAAIYGAAMTLRRGGATIEGRSDELIALMATEADRLARTINDVLWASRLETGMMELAIESCDPRALLEHVVSARRTHLPERVELELDGDGPLPAVAADPDKVRQVLENLIDNAVKYSPDGGVVRLSAAHAGRYVRFVVDDEGLGIPPGERERIFSKFYRLDPGLTRGVGGTGLGLYISRALVQRMDGRIHVEGNARGGSTFVVELPAAR